MESAIATPASRVLCRAAHPISQLKKDHPLIAAPGRSPLESLASLWPFTASDAARPRTSPQAHGPRRIGTALPNDAFGARSPVQHACSRRAISAGSSPRVTEPPVPKHVVDSIHLREDGWRLDRFELSIP